MSLQGQEQQLGRGSKRTASRLGLDGTVQGAHEPQAGRPSLRVQSNRQRCCCAGCRPLNPSPSPIPIRRARTMVLPNPTYAHRIFVWFSPSLLVRPLLRELQVGTPALMWHLWARCAAAQQSKACVKISNAAACNSGHHCAARRLPQAQRHHEGCLMPALGCR